LLADGEVTEATVRDVLPQVGTTARPSGSLAARVEGFEKDTIRAELERSHHNMAEAARALGLERSHLYKKCAQLGIDVKSLRNSD
jgi:DNA-binding NtrC family response regulator